MAATSFLSASLTLMKTRPLSGQGGVGGHLRFGVGDAQVGVQAHDFARGTHFRGEQDVLAEETIERERPIP